MHERTVHLADLNGFEFQRLCAIIFQTLGYGQVEEQPLTGDGGKDLVIHSNTGKIVVECKHQPKTSIGRPVIQKLHSAVISEGATKGIVVTSGDFSKQAIEHARSLQPTIELVDKVLLLDMASRAGIALLREDDTDVIYTFRLLSEQEQHQTLVNYLDSGRLVSYPSKASDRLEVKNQWTFLRPVYQITYSIDSEFSTTVGVIHRVNESNTIFIEGNNGQFLDERLVKYFSNSPPELLRRWDQVSTTTKAPSNPFRYQLTTVKEMAVDHIIRCHSTTVSYTGRNNQTYSKACVPSKNSIFIDDISLVYLPEYRVRYALCGREHQGAISCDGSPKIMINQDSTSFCKFCGTAITGAGLLCNECGQVTCTKKQSIFKSKSHGFHCEKCGKTICADCAYHVSKYIFFRSFICSECASRLSQAGKKARRVPRK